MENHAHLAIASIPIQKWGEVYDEEQAFYAGTIFPELNKPFYVTVQGEAISKTGAEAVSDEKSEEGLLFQIQKTGFVLDDLRLYLDTHPECKEGLKLYKSMLKRIKALKKEFALKYYPLTPDCVADIYEENPDSACYCWPEGKIPWEGVCR